MPPRPQPATWVLIPRSLRPPGTQSELGRPFPIWRRKKRDWLGFPLALDTSLHLALLGGSMTAPPTTMMAPSGSPFLHPLLPRPTAALTSTTCGIPPVLKPIQKKALESVYLGCSQPLRSPSIASLNHLQSPEWRHTHTEKGLCLTLQGWCLDLGVGWGGMYVTPDTTSSHSMEGRCTTFWVAQRRSLGWKGPERMLRDGGRKGGPQAGTPEAKARVLRGLECLRAG